MALTINDTVITAIGFAFDGCHKIYLLENEKDCEKMHDYGYDLYLIEGLPEAWLHTCSLRFIESADLTTTYVRQFEPAFFKGWNIDPQLQAELDEMAQEQLEANERI